MTRWGKILFLACLLVLLATGSSRAGQGEAAFQPGGMGLADWKTQPGGAIQIYLKRGSFDPLQHIPDLPVDLSLNPDQAEAAGIYILQFTGPVLPEWMKAVSEAGGQLGDYLPDFAFLVRLEPAARARLENLPFVRWIGPYQPAYKISPSVTGEKRSYRLLLAPWADVNIAQQSLAGISIWGQLAGKSLVAVLEGEQIVQAARLPEVTWIEPLYLNRTLNDVGGGQIMGGLAAWANGFTGAGVTVAVADTGLDTGDPANIHQDFSGRVDDITSWPVVYADYGGGCSINNAGENDGAGDEDSGHGTHVTGSLAGGGTASGGQFRGLAYQASIVFQAVEQWTTFVAPNPALCPNGYYLTGIPPDASVLLERAHERGARVNNDSWGGANQYGEYDVQASNFDDFIYNHPDMVVVAAAGNQGTDEDKDGYVDGGTVLTNSLLSPGTAKNVITVGASESERPAYSGGYAGSAWWIFGFSYFPTSNDVISDNRQHLAAFSSRGPTLDSRTKPDLVAPGTDIVSTRSSVLPYPYDDPDLNGWGPYNQYYMYFGGTSMASPLTAGAAALVRDYYIHSRDVTNPSAALIKATLINAAVDISGYGNSTKEAGIPIPNAHEGWGRVDVAAVTITSTHKFVDHATGIGLNGVATYRYFINAGSPLKVTLAWSDYPGAPYAGKALVNDLDLRLVAPDGATYYWGNHMSGGWSLSGGSSDHTNNVENVFIQSPVGGEWTVEVHGHIVEEPWNSPLQPFALVVNASFISKPSVLSISPTKAANGQILTGAVIRGLNFQPNATVSLIHSPSEISGINVSVDPAGSEMTADFDLTTAAPGAWDVRVGNGPVTDTLENGFRVLDATLPELSITKTALVGWVRPGGWITYTVQISNAPGFATATGVVFTDTQPAGASLVWIDPLCDGMSLPVSDTFVCSLNDPIIEGVLVEFTLVVLTPMDTLGWFSNTVEVGSLDGDALAENNTDSALVLAGDELIYMPLVFRGYP